MNLAAIVVAAGASTRAGGSVPKPYRNLGGESVLAHTIRSLLRHERVRTMRVVIGAGHEEYFEQVVSSMNDVRLLSPVFGGATRGESVLAGLESVEAEHVIVHDGARPFPDHSATEILMDRLQRHDAVFLALPVHDTLCYIDSDGDDCARAGSAQPLASADPAGISAQCDSPCIPGRGNLRNR